MLKLLIKLCLSSLASAFIKSKELKSCTEKRKTLISIKLKYFHRLSYSLYHRAKIAFKKSFLIFDNVITLEFEKCLCNISIWITNLSYNYLITNKINRCLNILVSVKAKFNASKKRSKYTYPRWGTCQWFLHHVCLPDSDSYRQLSLLLIRKVLWFKLFKDKFYEVTHMNALPIVQNVFRHFFA